MRFLTLLAISCVFTLAAASSKISPLRIMLRSVICVKKV